MNLLLFLISNYKKILIFSFCFFLISLPLNTKKFIIAFDHPLNEFNSVFLYLSDLTLLFFIGTVIYFLKIKKINFEFNFKNRIFQVIFFLILFFLLFSILKAENKILALVFFVRIIFLILMFFSFLILILNRIIKIEIIFLILLLLGLLESLIGIFQFLKGHSLNLWFLGEPVANQFIKGVARYQVFNFSFLRSFGTLPHANIYGAFLVLTLASFYYFWFLDFQKKEILKRILLGLGIFLNILALVYSFSRSSWLAASFLTILILLFGFLKKIFRLKAFYLLLIVLIFYIVLNKELDWLIKPRINLPADSPSVNYRLIYNQIGFEIFKDKPLGVGLNNQLIYGINNFYYQKKGLFDKVEFQPIHNLYLMFLTELGIGFFIFSLFCLLFIFYFILKNKDFFNNLNFVIFLFIFLVFLFLGFMDHYFYTLQSGRLMFFLIFNFLLSFIFLNLKNKNLELN